MPGARVTLSSEIGRIGLLERENAAIFNACLRPLARRNDRRLSGESIAELGITAPLYLTQNDGTLMSADFAEQYPVLTFASGSDEFHARRGVSLRSEGRDGRRRRRHDRATSAR